MSPTQPEIAPEVAPGTLLIATPREAAAASSPETFAETVILVVDREPSGITTAICLNRPMQARITDSSALALLFVPEPDAPAYWGGPMGSDPAVLAQFSATDGLEWFHLPLQQLRPFPLPEVGVIAVAEHTAPFEDRIKRARLFIGLCVWARGQLEREIARGDWRVAQATADIIFSPAPATLWTRLSST